MKCKNCDKVFYKKDVESVWWSLGACSDGCYQQQTERVDAAHIMYYFEAGLMPKYLPACAKKFKKGDTFKGPDVEVIEPFLDDDRFIMCWYRGDIRFFPWVDLKSTGSSKLKKETVDLHYIQSFISSLMHYFYNFGINSNIFYQREYCWSQEDRELLYDSIFNGRDIGKFVLNQEPFKSDEKSYTVIDGKQRLDAITGLYEERYSYKGLYFSDFSFEDQHIFKDHSVALCLLKELNLTQQMEVFLNINTTGKVQNYEHLEFVKNLIKIQRSVNE